ncbi:short-chain dehydrogenase [Actinokineospora fastidiosa]|uniref:Short-chain dehydrogenase n=2 Tax=Pseudonocardiaceae TaxID=2070 RepID=A0A918GL93_9PSEU|nr:Gluconate 5-dehydrogenase [Actinokineospora sp. UTMC 2448]GGS42611.1 short-chain dehydrogenase [Actinokineospora fastidiosa]
MTRKNILITGASSGLGAEMARQFAARGRNLALAARRVENLDGLKAEITAANPGITVSVRALDVNDHDAVFKVFGEFRDDLGSLDRVIVNAGLGKGQPIGTGYFAANKQTAETNFVAALAQCEAAMEILRAQNAGHLVMISSMSAMRGMPRNLTTYAATKAGVSALAEGIRADVARTPIKVTTIHPGYIRSEMNERVAKTPLMVDTRTGVTAMVKAIESETGSACVPRWPWSVLGFAMRHLPLGVVARMS